MRTAETGAAALSSEWRERYRIGHDLLRRLCWVVLVKLGLQGTEAVGQIGKLSVEEILLCQASPSADLSSADLPAPAIRRARDANWWERD